MKNSARSVDEKEIVLKKFLFEIEKYNYFIAKMKCVNDVSCLKYYVTTICLKVRNFAASK